MRLGRDTPGFAGREVDAGGILEGAHGGGNEGRRGAGGMCPIDRFPAAAQRPQLAAPVLRQQELQLAQRVLQPEQTFTGIMLDVIYFSLEKCSQLPSLQHLCSASRIFTVLSG